MDLVVSGCSVKMVLLWFCGDVFKTLYFVVRLAPTQFWLCGSFQVMLDIAIMFQVLYYAPPHRRPSDSNFASVHTTS